MPTDNDLEIAVLKSDMKYVKKELETHSSIQEKLLEVLTDIRLEISGAKAAVKTSFRWLAGIIILITAAYTVNWLQVPSVSTASTTSTQSTTVSQPLNKY
jgi:hypothetical protein